MKKSILIIFTCMFMINISIAAPVLKSDALKAVTGWLRINNKPFNQSIIADISDFSVYADTNNKPLFYVVSLKGGGFVVSSSDDLIEPIIVFSSKGSFNSGDSNPLWQLVYTDLSSRTKLAEQLSSKLNSLSSNSDGTTSVNEGSAKKRWVQLIEASDKNVDVMGASGISEVRVSPLVQSEWSQTEVYGENTFNYHTPNNYPCGCVATAIAQIMRYFQYPVSGIGVIANTIEVNGISQLAYTRGGDGAGGAYNWSLMPLIPFASTPTQSERSMIGSLCYDAGVACGMSYTASGSGATEEQAADGLQRLGYSNSHYYIVHGSTLSPAFYRSLINSNLDAGCPVIIGIYGTSSHDVVCDGYGFDSTVMYHHLNMGWGGYQDLWYALPDISNEYRDYSVVRGFCYNIFPNDTGEIISGRVLDSGGNPIEGAEVSAAGYNDLTDANGVYALAGIPAGTYTISASSSGYLATSSIKTIQASFDYLSSSGVVNENACGNLWGVDFILQLAPSPEPDLVPHQPTGWDSSVVASVVTGTASDADSFTTLDTIYIDFCCKNTGTAIAGLHKYGLYIDGSLVKSVSLSSLGIDAVDQIIDFNAGMLSLGAHEIRIECDLENVIDELFENNNQFSRIIYVELPDDSYEPNDALGDAYTALPQDVWLSSLNGNGLQVDEDWYRIEIGPDGNNRVVIDCTFSHSEGNIDLALYDGSGALISESESMTDNECIECFVASSGYYYVQVFSENVGNAYDLRWNDFPLTFSGGDGTEVSPYIISTKEDLLALRSSVYYYDSHFSMTSDIDLSGENFSEAVLAANTTDGTTYSGSPFTGVLDGNGHVVRNLTITTIGGSECFLGLFGKLDGAEILNLGVENILITDSSNTSRYIGGFCGQNSGSKISGCYVDNVSSQGGSYVGGFCGLNSYSGEIFNCYATGVLIGSGIVGGFCGYNYQSGSIQNSYVACAITSAGVKGGFCAGADATAVSSFCYWDTDVAILATSSGGTGRTTTEMQQSSTFVGWDFAGMWYMNIYPQLMIFNTGLVIEYELTVERGGGGGNYTNNQIVAIVADAPVSGYAFSHWSVDPESYLSNIDNANMEATSILMPDCPITVTANYYELKYSGGQGTELSPYVLSEKSDLLALSTALVDYDKYFKLTSDIDLSGEIFSRALLASNAVAGTTYSGTSFTGVLDGNGHVVRNLTITTIGGSECFLGLFGKLDGAEILNLGVENILITDSSNTSRYIGGFCGQNSGSTISGCYVDNVAIQGGSYAGGFCGLNSYSGVICDCYSKGDLSGDGTLGGFCGYNYQSGSIENSYAVCTITSGGAQGGFCGGADTTALSSECFWDITVSGLAASSGGIGKTTLEMQTQSTFTGWNFTDIWGMNEYPELIIFRDQTFTDWLESESVPINQRGESDIPMDDGVPNLLKYACGFPAMQQAFQDVLCITNGAANTFSALYYKSKISTGVSLEPIWSTSLYGPWLTTGMALELVEENEEQERWRVSVPLSDKGFIRLRATAE